MPARTVLLTGGRAPYTLELARVLADDGCDVHVAESVDVHLTRLSRTACHHRVPPPRQEPAAFIEALVALIRETGAELLLPTCEEVFWVARGRDVLSEHCVVPVPELATLRDVHHKGAFIRVAAEAGLPVPDTRVATTEGGLREAVAALGDVVIKPAWSRFATRVVRRPEPRDLARLEPGRDAPLVVQQWLDGPEWCSWSLAREGRLIAHACYAPRFTANAAAVAFTHVDQPRIREHAARFAEATQWTGFLAFDWREHQGDVLPIECNPRGTSGIHLLAGQPGFADALRSLVDPPHERDRVEPAPGTRAQVALAMLLYGHHKPGPHGGESWWRTLRRSRDVLWRRDDPLPLLLGMASYVGIAGTALRRGVGMLEASTWDIQWDGE